MGSESLYPPIDPTTFDLVVLGTGLPASVIAAAAATVGKSVLHLDPNPFYGSHFSSLPLHELSSFLQSQSSSSSSSLQQTDGDCVALGLRTSPVYSHVEISSHSSQLLELSRKFNLDLCGPRVLFCADSAVDLMLKSGASQYMEFKSVDANFVRDPDGALWSVPDSRAAIFKDRTLSLTEKNQLMRFFKLVQEHLAASGASDSSQNSGISEEDLESPFVEFLTKMRLPPKIKSAILYAIAMADYAQDDIDGCKGMLNTKDGIDRLSLYHSSVGRFQNAPGALLYPIYGLGELPQAFCRRAAVKGCLYVLRMPVTALLVDQGSRHYKGVKLTSGQDIFSQKLVVDPSFTVQLPLATDFVGKPPSLNDSKAKVARAICITRGSLKADVSNFLVVYPPKSLCPEQAISIRALQLGSNVAVCPPDMFVLYLSFLCDDADQGKKLLHAAINTLFVRPVSEDTDGSSSLQIENIEPMKPTLIWSALFIQELTMFQDSFESISFTRLPDGNLYYDDVLKATKELFQEMYPHEEFFPETAFSESSEDDGGLSLES